MPDLRVLVVDANATNRRILRDMLTRWGMNAQSAADSAEALRILESSRRAGQTFDLVLADYRTTEIGPGGLAAKIREDRSLARAVIPMLTTDRREDDAGGEWDSAACLLKPVRQAELRRAILSALKPDATIEEKMSEPPDVGVSAAEYNRPLNILVAEDNLLNQTVTVGFLEKHHHTVTLTMNGIEALAALEARSFDLVLMDVQMPGMDGFEATSIIRAHELSPGRHIPIIAMTAHAMKGDRQRCLDAGMDGYVSKPIGFRELFEEIDHVMRKNISLRERPAAIDAQ